MNENKLLKNIIHRIKEVYVKPALDDYKQDQSDYNSGVLAGLGDALTVIQNDIVIYLGEEALDEYNININCDDFSDLYEQESNIKFEKPTSLLDRKGEDD